MSTMTTSRPSSRARSRPVARRLDRDRCASVAVDRDADLLAELLELVDRGRALQVGRDQRRLASLLAEVAARASRRPSSCPSPGGRRAGSRSAASASTSRELPEPISSVSSSWTIFTTCCAGVSLFSTSSPIARSRTRATKSLTTSKLTSASSSARRISRIAL